MTLALRLALAALGLAVAALGTLRWTASHTAAAAESLSQTGELEAAAALSEMAHARWPHPASAAHTRASVAVLRGEVDTAEIWLERCEATLPSLSDALRLRAGIAQRRGDLPALEASLSRALRLNPSSPAQDWEGLARLREALGRPAAEIEVARRAAREQEDG